MEKIMIDIPSDKLDIFKSHNAEDFIWHIDDNKISAEYKGDNMKPESPKSRIVFDYFCSIRTVESYNKLEIDFFNNHDSDMQNRYAVMTIEISSHFEPYIRITSHTFGKKKWIAQTYDLSDLIYAYNKLNIADITKSVITSNFWDIDEIMKNDILSNNIFSHTRIDISDGLRSDKENAMKVFGMLYPNGTTKDGSVVFGPQVRKGFEYSDIRLISALISMSILFSIYRFLFGINIFIENQDVNRSYNSFLKIQPDFWHNANDLKTDKFMNYDQES